MWLRIALLFVPLFLLSAQAQAQSCQVIGVKLTGQYYRSNQRKCFSSVKKAEEKGFNNTSGASAVRGFAFSLTGAEEVPPVSTSSSGNCLATLQTDSSLKVMCIHNVQNPTEAHIHEGIPGFDGGIICDLGNGASPISATCNLAKGQVAGLIDGLLYLNVHSAQNSGGELRGQIK